MKQIYYAVIMLIRGKGSNAIKVVSLTLGLFVSILLFARVAFELSYNTGYAESEKLCAIMATYTIGEQKQEEPSNILFGPVTYAVRDAFPEEIVAATVSQRRWNSDYYLGDRKYELNGVMGDSLFFQTMGITLLEGNALDLASPDIVFLSEKTARELFGAESPVGKTLMHIKEHKMTIRGVFKPLEENNSLRPDVVMSFATGRKYGWGYYGWQGGDSYMGFVRLRNTSDIETINKRIQAVINQYDPFEPEKTGFGAEYHLLPIREAQAVSQQYRRMVTIMSLLGFAILLIAALNYVLVSVSSLTVRAKSVGVHKCNGATGGNIFSMFLWETAIIIGISLLLGGALLFSFREIIEDVMEVSVRGLFMWKTIWAPLAVIVLLFIIAGILPGKAFSSIPVTQVFRRYTEAKSVWKRPLLLVQFAGVSFVFGLLCIVFLQYRQVLTFNVGYMPEGVAMTHYHFKNPDNGKAMLRNLPVVEAVATSESNIAFGLSGQMIYDATGKGLFSTRFNQISQDYVPLLGIEIAEGRNVQAKGELLINQEFVRLMRWTDGAAGKVISFSGGHNQLTVVGVMKDFVNNSLYMPSQPVAFICNPESQYAVSVRLKPPYRENLQSLNQSVKELFPADNIVFGYMPDRIKGQYDSIRRFRDLVTLAFFSILLITFVGLIGYVNDEVRRRSKEIAIRKVNGAEASNILLILSRDVSWVALPGVLSGTVCAYLTGKEWLDQFEGFRTSALAPLLVISTFAVLLIIFGSVISKAWRIANEDPVKSIKSE